MSTSARPEFDEAAHFKLTIPPMLSFVSGYVDTCGFLGFYGLLTSQVTGSFVAAGAAFVQSEPGLWPKLLAMPMFMAGASAMTLLVAILKRRGVDPMPPALALVSVLILLFMAIAVPQSAIKAPDSGALLAAAVMAFLAMGAQSALVRTLFKGSVPANFMTGNVTAVAVEITDLLLARTGLLHIDAASNATRAEAAAVQLRILIPTIACFILGTVISAHAFIAIGFWSLLLATGLVMAAAIWASAGGSE